MPDSASSEMPWSSDILFFRLYGFPYTVHYRIDIPGTFRCYNELFTASRIQFIIATEGSRNIDSFRAGHTITAGSASHLDFPIDFLSDLFIKLHLFPCQFSCLGFLCHLYVLLHHFQRIHPRQYHRNPGLIPQPAKCPLCRSPLRHCFCK